MSFQAIPVWFLCNLCGASFQKVEKFIEHKKLNHGNEFQNIKSIVFEEKTGDLGNSSQETDDGNLAAIDDAVIITIPDRLKEVFPDTFHIEGTTEPIYLTAISASANYTKSNPPTIVNESASDQLENTDETDDDLCYSILSDPLSVQVKSEGDWIVVGESNALVAEVTDEILGIDAGHDDRNSSLNFNPNFIPENCIINTATVNPPESSVADLDQVANFFEPKTELTIFTSDQFTITNLKATKTKTKTKTPTTKEKTHGESRPFICELCGQGFKHQMTLKNHLAVHTNLRPYKCRHTPCTADFKTSKGLGQHTRLSHSDAKPFKCTKPGCSKAFKVKQHLSKHLTSYVHTGGLSPPPGRQFKCIEKDCNRSFMSSNSLKIHVLQQHRKKNNIVILS